MKDPIIQHDFDISRIDEYRKSHNTSVLAIMFTDIEGFTAYTNKEGDVAAAAMLGVHDSVIASAIQDNDGIALKKIGDSFLAIFADPSLSVKSALHIQQELTKQKFPLKVRIGIHLGQVALVQNMSADIFGNHVNIASRVESLAKGGQILMTRTVYDSAYSWVRSEFIKYKYHGKAKLKGIEDKEDIYQVGFKDDSFSAPEVIRKRTLSRFLAVGAAVVILSASGYLAFRYVSTGAGGNIQTAVGEEKVFSAAIERILGRNETLEQLRESAILEAKGMAMWEAADFLRKNFLQDNSGQNKELTQQDILALTAGVASAKIVSEQAVVDGEKYCLKLACEVSLNTANIAKRLSDLRQSQNKFDDFKGLQSELDRLRNQVSSLKTELDSAKQDQVEKLKTMRNGVSSAISAAEWYEKALNEKDPDKKIEYCANAIKLSPDWSRPYNSRGVAYYYKGEFDLAIADFNKAMTLEPGYVNLYNNRGNAYSDKGDFDLALADFDKALKLDPKTYQAYCNRGTVYGRRGEIDKAIVEFDKALQVDPNFSEALFDRAFAYYIKLEYDKAIPDISKVISLNTEDAEAYNCRGLIYTDKGDVDKAIADFNKALTLKPSFAEAYYCRGNAYLKKGDNSRARLDYLKAKELGYAEAGKKLEEMEGKKTIQN